MCASSMCCISSARVSNIRLQPLNLQLFTIKTAIWAADGSSRPLLQATALALYINLLMGKVPISLCTKLTYIILGLVELKLNYYYF